MGKVELRLEIDADLLARARAAGTEPLQVLEDALRALPERTRHPTFVESAREKAKDPEGALRRARAWADENREAIAEHERHIREHGLLSDHPPFKPRWLR